MQTFKRRVFVTALALVLAAFLLTPVAMATSDPDPRIIPNVELPNGSSYGLWAEEWIQWVVTGSLAERIQLGCGINQSGSVFFLLPEGFDDGSQECVIPSGKRIFFNLGAMAVMWSPEDCTDAASCASAAAAFVDQHTVPEVEIDGVPVEEVPQYRAASQPFAVELAPGSWLVELGYPAGIRDPAVADAHWLMLAPLPVGEHFIYIRTVNIPTGNVYVYTVPITVANPSGQGPRNRYDFVN